MGQTETETQQGVHYGRDYDYVSESPHLKHRHLNEMLVDRMATSVPVREGRNPEILEIGGGDGSVSERLLALGFDLTATEMSAESVDAMRRRFSRNDRFRAELDEDGSLDVLGDRQFDAVIFASVLHHIPDYLSAISTAVTRLRPGGSLISIQDPLWYPRLPASTVRMTNAFFLSWRLTRGNLLRGVKTRLGRMTRGVSEEATGDVVEYHVVRNGVDELAVQEHLEPDFDRVEIVRYWSSQGTPQQRAGEKLARVNTFAVFATGRN